MSDGSARRTGDAGPPGPGEGARPRLGHMSFLNSYPLLWSLRRTGVLPRVSLHLDTPDKLSDDLVAGRLDIGPITVAEYLRHSERLLLLPGLAIGCDGPVLSCNIVSKVPLPDLHDRPVGLGTTSRTTTLLAQLLLERRLGIRPRYTPCAPTLPAVLRHADAGVLIGDVALRAYLEDGPRLGLAVHDTGALWKQWTGLPMVFAVWAVRREFADRHPARAEALARDLRLARAYGEAHLDVVARDATRLGTTMSPRQVQSYFRRLSFDLTPGHLDGMRRFARLAAEREAVPEHQRFSFLPSPWLVGSGV
ncbi:menaquinone biosynthesis protein [Streptomyces nogalater]|uniref:Chorismate dehydratase n=1 Tax=Streptomyces nogalater TaxID=38314 RepID=A0ABW0WH26_STRNO